MGRGGASDDDRRGLVSGSARAHARTGLHGHVVAFEGLAAATILKVINDDLRDIGLLGWVCRRSSSAACSGSWPRATKPTGRPARPFVAGLALFGIGLVGAGLAPTMVVLVTARAVQGIGAGAIGGSRTSPSGTPIPESTAAHVSGSSSAWWCPASSARPSAAGLPRHSGGGGCSLACCRSSRSRA